MSRCYTRKGDHLNIQLESCLFTAESWLRKDREGYESWNVFSTAHLDPHFTTPFNLFKFLYRILLAVNVDNQKELSALYRQGERWKKKKKKVRSTKWKSTALNGKVEKNTNNGNKTKAIFHKKKKEHLSLFSKQSPWSSFILFSFFL